MDKATPQNVLPENIATLGESVILILTNTQNNLQDILAGLQNSEWFYPDQIPFPAMPNSIVDRLREIEVLAKNNLNMLENIHRVLGIGGMKPALPPALPHPPGISPASFGQAIRGL